MGLPTRVILENMGEAIVNQIVCKGLVKDYGDIYRLRLEDVMGLDKKDSGFQRKDIEY